MNISSSFCGGMYDGMYGCGMYGYKQYNDAIKSRYLKDKEAISFASKKQNDNDTSTLGKVGATAAGIGTAVYLVKKGKAAKIADVIKNLGKKGTVAKTTTSIKNVVKPDTIKKAVSTITAPKMDVVANNGIFGSNALSGLFKGYADDIRKAAYKTDIWTKSAIHDSKNKMYQRLFGAAPKVVS